MSSTTERKDWAVALAESKQPFGIFPTREFCYGETQAKRHFLSKKHFATTMLQALPLFALLGVLVAFFPFLVYFSFPIGAFVYAGIVEGITRRRIRNKFALQATPEKDASKSSR